MHIEPFFDERTFTITYVVFDEASRDAVIIDPVLDYEPSGGKLWTESLERLAAFVDDKKLTVHHVLETHAHADHLSGSQWLKRRHDAKVGIGARIVEVQETFRAIFGLGDELATDGRQFDALFRDGEHVHAGALDIEVIATPGHTPACVSYRIGDAVFTGDALFIEDSGTGRCDFPKGSAEALYTSVHDRLYALPDTTRVFVGHDYQPQGRDVRAETTIGKSKERNIQLRATTTRGEFVAMRAARDATLAPPRLLFPSVQVNVNAGRLPRARENGGRYFVVPLNLARGTDDDGTPL